MNFVQTLIQTLIVLLGLVPLSKRHVSSEDQRRLWAIAAAALCGLAVAVVQQFQARAVELRQQELERLQRISLTRVDAQGKCNARVEYVNGAPVGVVCELSSSGAGHLTPAGREWLRGVLERKAEAAREDGGAQR